eukprot:2172863-Prymnesium_polylepis.1
MLRLSQWEPPQWSYCRGILAALRQHLAAAQSKKDAAASSCGTKPVRDTSSRSGGDSGRDSKERHSGKDRGSKGGRDEKAYNVSERPAPPRSRRPSS